MALPKRRFKLQNRSLESCATTSVSMNRPAIKPMLPNKPRGVCRVNDRRVLSASSGSSARAAGTTDLPDGRQSQIPVNLLLTKYFRFTETQTMLCSLHPAPTEEGRSRTSRTRGGDAVAADALTDERSKRGRRNRVVPTPRRWRQVSRTLQRRAARRRWQSSIGSPRRTRISRKTIAQGRPECSPPQPVDFALSRDFFARGPTGAGGHPVFPAPSRSMRAGISTKLGRECAARVRFHVLSVVIPRMRGIQYSRDVTVDDLRLWNTGSSG
jgi:hypothetical protein